MSTSYYLRDKRITKEHVKQLEELQERFNDKIKELYQNMNLEIEKILPTRSDIKPSYKSGVLIGTFLTAIEPNVIAP